MTCLGGGLLPLTGSSCVCLLIRSDVNKNTFLRPK